MKLTIIGAGNMGGAIAKGLSKGQLIQAKDITCTARTLQTLEALRKFNGDFQLLQDNRAAVKEADVVVLAVKPWKMEAVISEIRPSLALNRQLIISIAAGIDFKTLEQLLTDNSGSPVSNLFRVIPNTAIEVKSSMTFVAAHQASAASTETVLNLFNELGKTLLVEESAMTACTALASCGIAFALRYIRASMEGGIELGIPASQARDIVSQTVIGAAQLVLEKQSHPETEIDKVTTPGGITIKGLNEMEHAGFTSAVIRGLKACN